LSFEELYTARDPSYELPSGSTFAQDLKSKFSKSIVAEQSEEVSITEGDENIDISEEIESEEGEGEPIDIYEANISSAINSFQH